MADLVHAAGPALSVAQLAPPALDRAPSAEPVNGARAPQSNGLRFAFSGTTSGSIAIWDLSQEQPTAEDDVAQAWACPLVSPLAGCRPVWCLGKHRRVFPRVLPAKPISQYALLVAPVYNSLVYRRQRVPCLQDGPQRRPAQPPPAARSIGPLAILHGAHQSGVNALAVAAAGAGSVLVLSGGDDQSLHVAMLAFAAEPAAARPRPPAQLPEAVQGDAGDDCPYAEPCMPPSEASRGGASATAGAERGQPGLDAVTHGTAPNSNYESYATGAAVGRAVHREPPSVAGLKGYAAAVDAQASRAVLIVSPSAMEAGAATSGATMGSPRRVSGVRLLGSCRVVNAHASALRGAWTDGSRAVTVGLDQRVRVWGIATRDRQTRPVDRKAAAQNDAVNGSSLHGPLPAFDGAADSLETESNSEEVAAGTGHAAGFAAHEDCVTFELREEACSFAQVLEPEDMAVATTRQAPGDLRDEARQCHGVLTIAVVGRGTEVLRYDSERRAFFR